MSGYETKHAPAGGSEGPPASRSAEFVLLRAPLHSNVIIKSTRYYDDIYYRDNG